MKFWEDQSEYTHKYKKKELGAVFSRCPERLFPMALELGAGDGFQATLLTRYVSKLISTELNPDILKNKNTESIEYRVCDAEEAVNMFDKKQFDLIFSSNLLEHLHDPSRALSGIHGLLKDDGVTIHIMPNPFWKFCHLLLYILNRCFIAFERIAKKGRFAGAPEEGSRSEKRNTRRPLIHRMFTLKPHGASDGNIREFFAFTKSRWKKEFEKAGLELIRIAKGPVHSGYGFGLDCLRDIMERIGFSSEYIYVAIKKRQSSFYRKYFDKM